MTDEPVTQASRYNTLLPVHKRECWQGNLRDCKHRIDAQAKEDLSVVHGSYNTNVCNKVLTNNS